MSTQKKPSKPLGENGYKYRPQFGVIIICDTETTQEITYNQLKQQGYKLRVVSL